MKFYEAFNYLIQSKVPPYVYLFVYDGKLNLYSQIIEQFLNITIKGKKPTKFCMNFRFLSVREKVIKFWFWTIGASHYDETTYLLSRPESTINVEPDEQDKHVIENLGTLWTNFAKNK